MDRDLTDWREWILYCEEREQAAAEAEKEVPVPAYKPVYKTIATVYGYGGGWIDEERSPILPYVPQHAEVVVEPKCECGAVKCKTTHATWCPISNQRK